jgi:hypothetical protein
VKIKALGRRDPSLGALAQRRARIPKGFIEQIPLAADRGRVFPVHHFPSIRNLFLERNLKIKEILKGRRSCSLAHMDHVHLSWRNMINPILYKRNIIEYIAFKPLVKRAHSKES